MDATRAEGSYEGAFREAVVGVMARIAGGERDAVWELHDLAEPALARMLRSEARRIDVRIGDDDIFDLTLDAAIDLAKLARSWKPDGAPPWVWARRHITSLVHEHIGAVESATGMVTDWFPNVIGGGQIGSRIDANKSPFAVDGVEGTTT